MLSINLFNEKIFIFLWFWLCIVSIFNAGDLFVWCYRLILNNQERYRYVKRRIAVLANTHASARMLTASDSGENKRMFKRFVNEYLREDGILALRLLSRNSQDLIVSEVITNLYSMYTRGQRMHKNSAGQRSAAMGQTTSSAPTAAPIAGNNDFVMNEKTSGSGGESATRTKPSNVRTSPTLPPPV